MYSRRVLSGRHCDMCSSWVYVDTSASSETLAETTIDIISIITYRKVTEGGVLVKDNGMKCTLTTPCWNDTWDCAGRGQWHDIHNEGE